LITRLSVDVIAAAVTSDEHRNIRATANTNVTLNCTTDTANLAGNDRQNGQTLTILWRLQRENPVAPVTLFNGFVQNSAFPWFKVNIDEDTGRSQLTIYNIMKRDAGNYLCQFTHSSKVYTACSFSLVVTG